MVETDPERVQAFAEKLLGVFTGSALTKLVDIGYRTGLFEAATQGPATSQELADRAGLHERYVREWLAGMTTGGFFDYDPVTRTYALPAERAALLTGTAARNAAPMSQIIEQFGTHLPRLEQCFRHGGGIPYAEFRPEFTTRMDDVWRRIYDEQLIGGFLAAVPGLRRRLARGVRVADIGCGTGHAINLMAREYPNSTFIGYDIAGDAIEKANKERDDMAVSNASFVVLDVAQLYAEPPFEVITAFDAIHDQVAPTTVLRRVREALAPDGVFVMIDFKFSSNLERNVGNPFAPLYYGISLMHCMTVSLAESGAGLGAVWGLELARQMLLDAGFSSVDVVDAPRPQNCITICRKDD